MGKDYVDFCTTLAALKGAGAISERVDWSYLRFEKRDALE